MPRNRNRRQHTMMLLAATIGIGATILLLGAGYLFGAKRSLQAREQLREQGLAQAEELERMRQRLADQPIDIVGLREDLKRMQETVLQRDQEDESLRATVRQLLTPLMQRERLGFELAQVPTAAGQRGNLTQLLDQIADKGGFNVVLLSDDEGLPLAANSNAKDLERLAATASLLLLIAERIGRDGEVPAPLSLMTHDAENKVTLCRIFSVSDQRLLLTAVATGTQLTPTALDPALAKLETALSN